jgi:hypothetical protein
MAPRSRIELDKRLKAVADEAIREDCTIDEILDRLQTLGVKVSRSSVGRYAKNARQAMERFSEAREVAKVWADKAEKEPDGDIGQLLPMMLHAVAYSQINMMANETPDLAGKQGVGPRHVQLLAAAIKDIASTQKINADRILKIRKETAEKAAAAVEKVARDGGMTPETLAKLRDAVIGSAA